MKRLIVLIIVVVVFVGSTMVGNQDIKVLSSGDEIVYQRFMNTLIIDAFLLLLVAGILVSYLVDAIKWLKKKVKK